MFRKMLKDGLFPGMVTYNALINGYCKERRSWFQKPDGFTFTALIDGRCKQGRPEEANGILDLMIKKGISPDEVTWTALILKIILIYPSSVRILINF